MEIGFPATKVSCGFSIDFYLSVKNTQNGPSQSHFLMVPTRKTNVKYLGIGDGKVATSVKKLAPVFERYLSAYLDLVAENKLFSEAQADVQKLKELLDIEQFQQIVSNPLYQKNHLEILLTKVLGIAEITPLTIKFVQVLNENARLYGLNEIVDSFTKELAKRQHIPIIEVTSAQALSDAQHQQLKTQFEKQFASEIFLEMSIDPKLIAGLVVKIGSQMLDTSLKSKLDRVQSHMKGIG
jgi:F-type H+-transporting ATPase subunit delta